jgi:hypothetical protein
VSKIDPKFSEWLLKERLKYSLASRFFLRFHVSLMLGAAVATGWAANRALFSAGIDSMLFRHVASVLAAYGGFLVGLRIWIEYSGIKTYLDVARSRELTEGPVEVQKESKLNIADAAAVPDFGEGCAVVLFVLAVLGVLYAMGGYLIVSAPEFFADVVFELLLAAGLIRGAQKVDQLGTEGKVPLVTLWALAATLLVVVLFDVWAMHERPGAKTVSEALKIPIK